MERIILTVCVIGRNEEENLPRLIDSLHLLYGSLPFSFETILVDSASSDKTVEIASSFFDRVFVVDESKNLCAAAGRYVGTQYARGDWVLYLDGDMALSPGFVPVLAHLCTEPACQVGWVGQYRYIYDDGRVRDNALGLAVDDAGVRHFGGAVLLPRQLVLVVGNWNPAIFSNEEVELYTRLRLIGGTVRFVDTLMISHYTERFSKWQVLVGNFIPGILMGKKFYGFGQMLAARVKEGQILSLIRFFPYPFVYWLCLLATLILWAIGKQISSVVVFGIGIIYVWNMKGPNFIILYVAFIMQGLLGYRKYDASYTPKVRVISDKERKR